MAKSPKMLHHLCSPSTKCDWYTCNHHPTSDPRQKLTFLAAISTSQDLVIDEILSILTDKEYCKSQRIQPSVVDLLLKVRSLIATISSRALSNQCKSEFRQQAIEKHDKRLKELTVESKILWVAELENSNQVWKRIMQGLLAGQMSFLLRAGTDTLPTLLNLRWWRLRMDSSCPMWP